VAYKATKLENFERGWIVGHFTPTLVDTEDVEVAIKHYHRGDSEAAHHHKIATEITAIVSGRVRMCGRDFAAGDVIRIDPGHSTSFECLEDAVTVVVKHPGAVNDKYPDNGVESIA
jgi:anti-sigma factor ChrR (cupin superfamily)